MSSNRPSIQVLAPVSAGPREWGEELIVANCPQYLGKMITMRAGAAGGLQYHREKVETMFLVAGQAWVDYDNGSGSLSRISLSPGMSVHVPAGAVHRVTAKTDCVLFECSTPHFGDRVRVEAEFGQPEVGGLPTTPHPSPDATGQP